MRRSSIALALAAALLSPAVVLAAAEPEGRSPTKWPLFARSACPSIGPADGRADGQTGPEPSAETTPDRLAELRRQREEQVARRDRALVQFHTYGLPQYSLEVEAASKEIERLDAELAQAEAGR